MQETTSENAIRTLYEQLITCWNTNKTKMPPVTCCKQAHQWHLSYF
ncbi:hypothetical protein [Brevibacillus sp. IT-7CA2]